MRVVILEGCRRGGNTDALCGEFARGAKEEGHEVERVYLFDKEVHGCIDCLHCQEHGGTCVWKDDGCEILDTALDADVLVFASAIYYYGITGQLKTILDRFYAKHAQVHDKSVYFITSSAAPHEDPYAPKLDIAAQCIQGWVDCFGDDVRFSSTIGAWDMSSNPDVTKSPAYAMAYDQGRAL